MDRLGDYRIVLQLLYGVQNTERHSNAICLGQSWTNNRLNIADLKFTNWRVQILLAANSFVS